MARPWLNDKRAYTVYRHWLRQHRARASEYGPFGDFQAWAFLTANHFWKITDVWQDNDLRLCCERLGVEAPPSYILESFSEDQPP